MLDALATLEAIRSARTYRRRWCEVLEVRGPDAKVYLQGQLSQDLDGLSFGECTEAFLLEPNGKVVSYLRVQVLSDEAVLLVSEDGFGAAAEERLRRFKLRVRAEISRERLELVEVRGPTAAELASALEQAPRYTLAVDWPGYVGVDLIGPGIELPEELLGSEEAFDLARIVAGVPVMGAEVSEKTIPQELGITKRAVSFTKGCYTGQELVARIDARGNNVARRLCRVHGASGAKLSAPGELFVNGVPAGTLTSVAEAGGEVVGLGFVKRAISVPTTAQVDGEEVLLEALGG